MDALPYILFVVMIAAGVYAMRPITITRITVYLITLVLAILALYWLFILTIDSTWILSYFENVSGGVLFLALFGIFVLLPILGTVICFEIISPIAEAFFASF